MRRARQVATCLLLLLAPIQGSAAARVQVVATDPAGETVTLGRGETFWVRLAFVADEPASLWVRPFFQGKEVPMATNPSVPHSGSGYALGWFGSDKPYRVDEIRLRLGGGKPYAESEAGSYRVNVVGTGAPAAVREKAPWVDELRAEEEAVRREEYEKRKREPPGAGETALFAGFMLAVGAFFFASLGWPAWGLWKWRGRWRIAAGIPAALMTFVVLRIAFGVALDPTSHNLWPFEILMFGAPSVIVMAALAIARRVKL
jgi:hypothetical protein